MPDGTERTSETQAPATGANGGEQPPTGVPSTPPSEGGPGAQEQPKTEPTAGQAEGPPAASLIDQEERYRRDVQSRSDQIVAQKLQQIEQERAQKAEAERIRKLPDKDYRRAMEQQQSIVQAQQVMAQQMETQLQAAYGGLREQVLAVIPDATVQEQVRQKALIEGPGGFATAEEFIKAAMDAAMEVRQSKLRASIQKSEQQAAQKEARAEQGGMPQLGSGLSGPNLANMTAGEKIRWGLEVTQRDGK